MRELTFAGFLKQYVRALSLNDTNSISALSQEAETENARLREPLFLYAYFTGKKDALLRNTNSSEVKKQYDDICNRYDNEEQLLQALMDNDPSLSAGYRKVWRSYFARKNRKDTDAHTKEMMRQRILALQKEKGVSNYRIYKELGLNPGNINDWLKNGDSTKVSYHTAKRVMDYVLQY